MTITNYSQELYRARVCRKCAFKVRCRDSGSLPVLMQISGIIGTNKSESTKSICTRALMSTDRNEDLCPPRTTDHSTGASLPTNLGAKIVKKRKRLTKKAV